MSPVVSCPDCRSEMSAVQAKARTGYLLALDQCSACGGLWFDRWELFPLAHDEVSRLDTVDDSLLLAATRSRNVGRCPRCEVDLQPFRDANLPEDARIARCGVCEGMWLQRGQLSIVKATTASNAPVPLQDPELQRLVDDYAQEVEWSAVSDLDAATYEHEAPPPEFPGVTTVLNEQLPWTVLGALFRLFLRA